MRTRDELVSRLRDAYAIFQQRIFGSNILEQAADALEAKDAEIERLTTCLSNAEDQFQAKVGEVIAQMDRISDLERQLAGETERCVTTSSRDAYGLFTRREWFSLPMELRRRWWQETEYGSKPASDELITEAKTAIRGGAK